MHPPDNASGLKPFSWPRCSRPLGCAACFLEKMPAPPALNPWSQWASVSNQKNWCHENNRVKCFWTGTLALIQLHSPDNKELFYEVIRGVWGTRAVLFGCSVRALLSLRKEGEFPVWRKCNTIQRLRGLPRTFGQWRAAGAMKSCFRQGLTLKKNQS